MAVASKTMDEEGEMMDTQMMQGEVKRSSWWLALLRSVAQSGYWTVLEPVNSFDDYPLVVEKHSEVFFTDGPQGRLVQVEIQSSPARFLTAANAQ